MRIIPLRTLDVECAMSSGHHFLTAASGLVLLEEQLCVIADDELHLALFPVDGAALGGLVRLQPGALPQDAKKRKKQKPDFEILVHIPRDQGHGERTMLALGSCSKPQRMRGVLIRLDAAAVDVKAVDLRPLCDALMLHVTEINLEGAIVDADRILLFNRGNMRAPVTHIFETALSALLAGGAIDVTEVKQIQLPVIDGVQLTVTDACRAPDGMILLSTVAEATGDSYEDGSVVGAAIICLDQNFNVIDVEMLVPTVKVEGVAVRQTAHGPELLCVTDADDPERPSVLFHALLV